VPRLAVLAAALVAGCSVRAPPEEPMPPEVTLNDVRLRNFRGSTLSAVGRAKQMSYHRATADVRATDVELDVFRIDPPPPPGTPPPTSRILAREALGNLLTRGIDASGGVTVRTPAGLFGRTERGYFDTPSMRARGSGAVAVDGPDGFWLRGDGFELDLRNEVYDFENPVTHTRGP